jgi:hypothetical protein
VDELKVWMRQQRDRLAPSHDLAKAINYILSRWVAFTRFLDDGRICLSNNAAERAVRCVAVGRRNWTFAGSDAGGHRAAAAYTLIETCKLNDVDPQAWLADVLARLPDHPASRIAELCRGIGKPRASPSKPDHLHSHGSLAATPSRPSTPISRIKSQGTSCETSRESRTNDQFHGIDELVWFHSIRSIVLTKNPFGIQLSQ